MLWEIDEEMRIRLGAGRVRFSQKKYICAVRSYSTTGQECFPPSWGHVQELKIEYMRLRASSHVNKNQKGHMRNV